MTTRRPADVRPDPDRTLADYLADEAPRSEPPHLLPAVLARTALTRRRPAWRIGSWWTRASVVRPISDRRSPVFASLRFVLPLILVLAGGWYFVASSPGGSRFGQAPSPTPTASPMAVHDGPLVPGTYAIRPFVGTEWDPCLAEGALATAPGCQEPTVDDHLRFTFDVPDGWASIFGTLWRADDGNSPPGGAGIGFFRGGSLYSDLCPPASGMPDIPVGPSVDDFVQALVDHPLLDATEPVDVTLDGYPGRYLELQLPQDVSACNHFVWQPGIYAQGPDHLWHTWVLDVDGVRVVVRADTYPGTTQEVRDQIQAILGSLRIDQVADPSPAPSSPRSPTPSS